MKKIDYFVKNYNRLSENITCPFCNEKLNFYDNSLQCVNKHTFNISKKGTTILYKTSKLKQEKIYNKNLFFNRRKFINSGFYDELHNKISTIINKYDNAVILDMGSGEGTHDYKIKAKINNVKTTVIGIDLAKDGIDLFNDYIDDNFIGIVADLNNVPLTNESIDIILNILSPSNENEMSRLLKKDGIIIKVTPKKQYLHELREVLNIKQYENENVIFNNINSKYEILIKDEYVKTFNLNEEEFKYLINMTPLSNNYKDIPKIDEITIALNIYVLRNKNEK